MDPTPPPRYVSYDRWDAEHQRLKDRVKALEQAVARHRDRQWATLLALMTGLILPLIIIGIIALAHDIIK